MPSEDRLPARAPALREVGGDKLFVVFDPEDGSRLALEVAYSLARARVLMAKGGVEGLDAPALRAEVERALGAMEDVRRIKLHLTNAAGGIESARGVLEGMAERVRGHLAAIDALVVAADDADPGGDGRERRLCDALVDESSLAWPTSGNAPSAMAADPHPSTGCFSRRPRPRSQRGCPRASPRRRRTAWCGRRPRPGRP